MRQQVLPQTTVPRPGPAVLQPAPLPVLTLGAPPFPVASVPARTLRTARARRHRETVPPEPLALAAHRRLTDAPRLAT